jgi:hypothetical protein
LRKGLVLLGCLIALESGNRATAQPTDRSLFVDRQTRGFAALDSGVFRERPVDLRLDLLRRARTGDSLDLNLFEDVFVMASMDRRASRGTDRFTWSGSIEPGGG